jgi:hypothetical protein
MKKIPSTWSYAEFHAFVMLYAASVDGQITQDEENLIIPTVSPDTYKQLKELFQDCDDADCIDAILAYKDKYCATQADKDKILADMTDIFKANARFDQIEKGILQMMKRMI